MVAHQHLAILQGWRFVGHQFEIAKCCFSCGAVVEKYLSVGWQKLLSGEGLIGRGLIRWQTSAGGVGVGAFDVFESARGMRAGVALAVVQLGFDKSH